MGDLAAVAFVIVLVIAVVLFVFHVKNKNRPRLPGHSVSIWAANPNEAPIKIGSADVEDPDFLDRIEEVRSEGYMKLAALNSGRKEKNWRLEEHTGE